MPGLAWERRHNDNELCYPTRYDDGGNSAIFASFAIELEDDSGVIILEDGSGYIELEDGP